MKTILLLSLTATLSFAAIAQTIELPQVNIPQELTRGEFAEGTITRLTPAEVAEFRPWAQNARNTLNRALARARSLPLRERLPEIETAVRNVVGRSGSRQYQMLMRFSLNRGLLLVEELERNVDMNLIGSQENAIDLLQRSITVALSFYESDLTFQERAQSGDSVVVIPHARFGAAFMQEMYPSIVNVLDATAQYRLLYKLIEMVNWDLSRDAEAPRYAESIVEAFELMDGMPEVAEGTDRINLARIRRLNSLKIINLRALSTATRAENTNEADGIDTNSTPSPMTIPSETGSVVRTHIYDANYGRVREVRARIEGGSVVGTDGVTVSASYVQRLVTSRAGISVGAYFYDANYGKIRRAAFITERGIVIASDNVVVSANYAMSLVHRHSKGIAVGDQFYDRNYGRLRTAAYIVSTGIIVATDGVVVSNDYVARVE